MRTWTAAIASATLLCCSEPDKAGKPYTTETASDTTGAERSIFYHEDDYCQVQLTLIENLPELRKEAKEVAGFANENAAGDGFADILVRAEGPYKLADKGIRTREIEDIVAKSGFDRASRVFTGYGQTHREERENATAYGQHGCAIFFDHQDNVVEHIWISYHWGTDDQDKERLAKCLSELGREWRLVLMDWNGLRLVNLEDSAAIHGYLYVR